jgi:PIN domain nuclease of toxin-antitoxin system
MGWGAPISALIRAACGALANGYRELPISSEHAIAVNDLPRLRKDPFDRLLVAQAMTEPLKLVTHDARVAEYGEAVF